jgi:MFS family permease
VNAAPPSSLQAAPATLPASYWKQWTATVISNLGDGINFVAMPLLAISLTDDDRLLALTTLATFLPWLILALPIGVVVDRTDHRRLMIIANLVRVGIFTLIAFGASGGWISIWPLLGLLLIVGSCEVLFDSSAQALLPGIVEPALLARANGLLYAAEVIAGSIAGLSIGALLFDVSVALPFTSNAVSFVVAAALIATIRTARKRPARVAGSTDDVRLVSGLRWLRDHRLLRTLALMFTVTNLGLMFGQGIFVRYAIDELGLSSAEFGILLAITAMGAATGGLIGYRVMGAIGVPASVIVPYLVFGAGNFVIGFADTVWVVAATGFVLGAAITVWNVVTVTVRQQLIPPDRFGRVNSVYRWLGAAASAVGIGAGGLVAHQWSVRVPFVVGGSIALLGAVLFARPVLAGLKSQHATGAVPITIGTAPVPGPRLPAPAIREGAGYHVYDQLALLRLTQLNEAQRRLVAFGWLRAEVTYAGFRHYFFDSRGDGIADAIEAADAAGAASLAVLLRSAAQTLAGDAPTAQLVERDYRRQLLVDLDDAGVAALDMIDRHYRALEATLDLDRAMDDLVWAARSEFFAS